MDGSGTQAKFPAVTGLAVDVSGNVYAAQQDRVRKIATTGLVSTLVGGGDNPAGQSFADGVGTAARFKSIGGIAVDSQTNIYVADTGNYAIRKISASGAVTTLAGGPNSQGYIDGPIASAKFTNPWTVTLDNAGNLYVLDMLGGPPSFDTFTPSQGYVIRKINTAGVVTTVPGGRFDGVIYPGKIVVDNSDNIYVTVLPAIRSAFVTLGVPYFVGSSYIRKISPSGVQSTLAGSGESTSYEMLDGQGSSARFASANDIAIDSKGMLYVTDTQVGLNNSAIRRITPEGLVSTVIGKIPRATASNSIEYFPHCANAIAIRQYPSVYVGAGYCGGNSPSRVVFVAQPQ